MATFDFNTFDPEAVRAGAIEKFRFDSMIRSWDEQRLLDYAFGEALVLDTRNVKVREIGKGHYIDLEIREECMDPEKLRRLMDATVQYGREVYVFTGWTLETEIVTDYGGEYPSAHLAARFELRK